jgi:hypothetical protein
MTAAVRELTAKENVGLKIHPVANLFPMIDGAEYEQLRDDIRQHGVREPVWVWQEPGKDFLWLVDGRNRRRCCVGLGRGVPARHWPGDGSLVEFVMSLNFHRRQLKASQRALVAAKAMPLLEAEARKRQGTRTDLGAKLPTSEKGRAAEQAAKAAHVSRRQVQDAKAVLKGAHHKVTRAAQQGRVSVSDAAKVAGLPADKQLEALAKVEAKAARTLTAALAADDRALALAKGAKHLAKARAAFAKAAAAGVVGAIDQALELARQLQTGGTMAQAETGKEPVPVWAFDVPGHGRHEAEGHTKGEARAVLKRRLGLDRLPPGTTGARAAGKKHVA